MEGDSRFRCKEDNARLGQRLEAASACVEALQHELAVLQQAHSRSGSAVSILTGVAPCCQMMLHKPECSRLMTVQQEVAQPLSVGLWVMIKVFEGAFRHCECPAFALRSGGSAMH
eukprot:1159973-Pelagomonas_calceolata.AAC.9